MWKPDESLDDYIVRPAPEVPPDPPRSVSLRRTGELEVLKPLTREVRVRSGRTGFRALRPLGLRQPIWFRSFLAAGSVALVMVALVLVSAILVGINDSGAGPDLAINGEPDDQLVQLEEPFTFDVYSSSTSALATGGLDSFRSNARRRPARPSIRLAANRAWRRTRPAPQAEEPRFVPTTLVIYAENGVINTRIEPWFQGADRKMPTSNN